MGLFPESLVNRIAGQLKLRMDLSWDLTIKSVDYRRAPKDFATKKTAVRKILRGQQNSSGRPQTFGLRENGWPRWALPAFPAQFPPGGEAGAARC
jgi:hypothetical protein